MKVCMDCVEEYAEGAVSVIVDLFVMSYSDPLSFGQRTERWRYETKNFVDSGTTVVPCR